MQIHKYMKQQVVSIPDTATARDAAALFAAHHIGTLPVVNTQQKLVGILYMRDLLRLVMPGFIELMEDFDFVLGDFGDYEEREPPPEVEAKSVRELMETAVSVTADSGLLRAFALIVNHNLTDLPVVDQDGRLVGIASHVDIGAALLERWNDSISPT
ncbi:MAG: CBS domain-containing protein [Anaerolineaceae bacterium]|nr:CBS domain-containing protein [Anaerolineaceae bacterium]